MSRQKDYYAFARPNQMIGHRFTDDVALCKAISHSQAKKIFSRYYADVQDDEISKISGRVRDGIVILTDY